MPSSIRQNCNTCKYGIPHEDHPGFRKCGIYISQDCITYSRGRVHWEPSYKAMADSLEEFEKSQGIVNDFIKVEEMRI